MKTFAIGPRPVVATLLVVLLLVPVACDSAGPGDEPERPDGPLTPAQTAQVVADIEAALTEAFPDPQTPPSERNLRQELLDAASSVRALAGVDTVVVHDSTLSATAVLDNGIPFMIGNNRLEDATPSSGQANASAGRSGSGTPQPAAQTAKDEGTPSRPAQTAQAQTAQAQTASAQMASGQAAPDQAASDQAASDPPVLPQSKKAIAVAIDGGSAQASTVSSYLSDAGYEVSSLGGSLQDMRQYGGAGVLYLDTHAASFIPLSQIEGQNDKVAPVLGLQTTTTVETTEEWFVNNEQALRDGRIVLSAWPNEENEPVEAKVAITESFIEEHWAFADGAFVMIHACLLGAEGGQGDVPPFDFSGVRQAVLQSANALVTFDDYTNASYAASSIKKTFQMLLGRDPYGRPWDLPAVRSALGELGLLTFEVPTYINAIGLPTNTNIVNLTFDSARPQMLATSIRRIDVIDDAAKNQGRLRIKGMFGTEKGRVTLSENELEVEEWTADRVVARSPFEGAAATGAVRVEHLQDVESNAVNVTKWTGPMEGDAYLLLDGRATDVRAESDLTVTFRADVHRAMEDPLDEAPEYPDRVKAYLSPASEGQVEGKGSYTSDDGAVTSLEGTNAYRIATKAQVDGFLGGSTQRAARPDPPAGANQTAGQGSTFGGRMVLRPKAGQAELCFAMTGFVTLRQEGPDGSTTEQRQGFPYSSALTFENRAEGQAPLACLPFTLSTEGDWPVRRSDLTVETGVEYRMRWDRFTATNPPER